MLKGRMEEVSIPFTMSTEKVKNDLYLLNDLLYLWKISSIPQKQAFVKGVFGNNFTYHDGIYRTPNVVGLFRDKVLILKEKGLLFYEQTFQKELVLQQVPGTGIEPVFAP
jgi:hypothetical protein